MQFNQSTKLSIESKPVKCKFPKAKTPLQPARTLHLFTLKDRTQRLSTPTISKRLSANQPQRLRTKALLEPERRRRRRTHESLEDAYGLDGVSPFPVQAEDGLHGGRLPPSRRASERLSLPAQRRRCSASLMCATASSMVTAAQTTSSFPPRICPPARL